MPTTSGGRANYSEAGFRRCRPTTLGCAAFCSRLAGSTNLHKKIPSHRTVIIRRWIDLAPHDAFY